MIDFDKMIDNYLYKEATPKAIGRYYPSEIGNCMRKIWYSYKYPLQVKPDLAKIFELGNILHDFVVKVLQSEKNPDVDLLGSEFPLKLEIDDFVISGRVDDLILLKQSGKSVLVEVKSCKDIIFVKEPQLSHVIQLQFYMHVTGIRNGVVLYIDKTKLQSKVFPVNYNETSSLSIIERFKTLHKHLTNSTLPVDEAKRNITTKWMCKFCEYAGKCDKNEV